MDNQAAPKSVLETLRTVEFRLGLRGYDVDEVDDYLEKVAVEADSLQEQLRQMTDRLRQAADRIGQLEAQKAAPAPAEVEERPVVEAVPDAAAVCNWSKLRATSAALSITVSPVPDVERSTACAEAPISGVPVPRVRMKFVLTPSKIPLPII